MKFTPEIDAFFPNVWWGKKEKKKKKSYISFYTQFQKIRHIFIRYLLLFIYHLHCLFFLTFHSIMKEVSWTAEQLLKDQPGERTAVLSPQEDETVLQQAAPELNGKLFTHHQKGKHKKDLRHPVHFAPSLYWAIVYWTPTNCILQVFLVLWCRQPVQCN